MYMKRNIIIEIAASLLVMLFIYASFSKFVDLRQFKMDMFNQPFPKWFSAILVWAVPITEILISLCLILPKFRTTGFVSAAILMSLFTLYTGLILLNVFHRIPCSCGGVIKKLSWTQHLVLNLFFLVTALIGIFISRTNSSEVSSKKFSANVA